MHQQSQLDEFIHSPDMNRKGFYEGRDLMIPRNSVSPFDHTLNKLSTVQIPLVPQNTVDNHQATITIRDWSSPQIVKQHIHELTKQIEKEKQKDLIAAYDRAMAIL